MKKLNGKNLEGCLNYILDNYLETKNNNESNVEFLKTIKEENFVDIFMSSFELKDRIDKDNYQIKMLFEGMGNKSDCPSIVIFNKLITSSAQKGYYTVFLFNKDMSGFYVSLNQGTAWYENIPNKNKYIEDIADLIRKELKLGKKEINLQSENARPRSYEKANIYSEFFSAKDFKEEDVKNAVWKCLEYLYKIKEITNGNWEQWNNINIFSKFCQDRIKKLDIEKNENDLKIFKENYGTIQDFKKMKLENYIYVNKFETNGNNVLPLANFLTNSDFGPNIKIATPKEKFGIAFESGKYVYKKQFGKESDKPEEVWKRIQNNLYIILKEIENAKEYKEISNIDGLDLVSTLKLAYAYFPEKLIGIGGTKNKSYNLLIDVLEKILGYKENIKGLSKIQLSFLANQKLRENDIIKDIPPQTLTMLIWEFCSKKFEWVKNEDIISEIIIVAAYDGKKSYADEFINEHRWQHFFGNGNKKINEDVNSIKVGSKIALKYDTPIDKKMGLAFVATGIVTENKNDGCNLMVEWNKLENEKKAKNYGGNIQNTLYRIDYKTANDKEKKLVDFVFNSNEIYIDGAQFDNKEKAKDYEDNENVAQNLIVYGVPGSGKSYYIENKLLKNIDREKYVKRVTFYPEYTYYDFIGQMIPSKDGKGLEPQKGPFTKILGEALKAEKDKTGEHFYLIIEELNRGNAEAIFGDIFQLLDRDENGKSRYSIDNQFISNALKIESDVIYLPSNLSIYATINNADQNVFNMDTAFGRRWNYELKLCNLDKNADKTEENGIYFDGYIKGTDIKWNDLRNDINNKIIEKKDEIFNAEEKRIGLYYIDKQLLEIQSDEKNIENLIDSENSKEYREKFANKLFRYLYLNVFKNDLGYIFKKSNEKTLEDYISEFKTNGDIKNILLIGLGDENESEN